MGGHIVLLVDEGLATGTTMRAAVAVLGSYKPLRIVVAVPAPPDTCNEFETEVDEVVCATTPVLFLAIGAFYEDFTQTTDEEVRNLLDRAATKLAA